jgi:hypothetical protein
VKECDLKVNFVWLKEVVLRYSDRIPSAYFLADCILQLDTQLEGCLLLPSGQSTKCSLALGEGGRIKKCMQYLRGLFRDTPDSAHLAEVLTLKKLLTKPPRVNGNTLWGTAEANTPIASPLGEELLDESAAKDSEVQNVSVGLNMATH